MVVELSKDIRSISLRSSWYSLLLHLEWHCSCRDQSEIPISLNTPYNTGEREEHSHSNSGYLVRTWTDDWRRPSLGQSIKSIWQHICYITNCQCYEILTRCYFIRRQRAKWSGLVQYLACLTVQCRVQRCDLELNVESELKYAKEQCHDKGNGEEFGSCKAQK